MTAATQPIAWWPWPETKQLVCVRVMDFPPNQDVGRLDRLSVVEPVPVVRRRDHGSGQVDADVRSLGAAERHEIGDQGRPGAAIDRPGGNRHVATQLKGVRQQPLQSRVRHHERHNLRHRDADLQSHACRRQPVEGGPEPAAGLGIACDDDGAAARAPDNHSGLRDLGGDHYGLGVRQIATQPGHVGYRQEVGQRHRRRRDEHTLTRLGDGERGVPCGRRSDQESRADHTHRAPRNITFTLRQEPPASMGQAADPSRIVVRPAMGEHA